MAPKPAVKELAATSAGDVLPMVVQGFWKGERALKPHSLQEWPRCCNCCCRQPTARTAPVSSVRPALCSTQPVCYRV